MDARRRAFDAFLSLHAHKATCTEEPVVQLQFCDADGTPPALDAPLVALTRNDVLAELDKDAELVRWLLHQMSTYDCRRQRVVGLVFDRSTVLSEVLWSA